MHQKPTYGEEKVGDKNLLYVLIYLTKCGRDRKVFNEMSGDCYLELVVSKELTL